MRLILNSPSSRIFRTKFIITNLLLDALTKKTDQKNFTIVPEKLEIGISSEFFSDRTVYESSSPAK